MYQHIDCFENKCPSKKNWTLLRWDPERLAKQKMFEMTGIATQFMLEKDACVHGKEKREGISSCFLDILYLL